MHSVAGDINMHNMFWNNLDPFLRVILFETAAYSTIQQYWQDVAEDTEEPIFSKAVLGSYF